jgi:hypothetical protein
VDTFAKLRRAERCRMGQGRCQFTDEFKREAVGLLASSGRPLLQIAKRDRIANGRFGAKPEAAGPPIDLPLSAPKRTSPPSVPCDVQVSAVESHHSLPRYQHVASTASSNLNDQTVWLPRPRQRRLAAPTRLSNDEQHNRPCDGGAGSRHPAHLGTRAVSIFTRSSTTKRLSRSSRPAKGM